MKVKLVNDQIIQVNKKILESEADGNFIGMAKFSKNIIPKFFNAISNSIKIDKNSYYTSAIELLINNGQSVNYISTNNLQWMDIDEPNEFDDAKILFKQLEDEL
jgi:choline kinase